MRWNKYSFDVEVNLSGGGNIRHGGEWIWSISVA